MTHSEFSFIDFMYPQEVDRAIRRLRLTALARGGLTNLQARYLAALRRARRGVS